MHVPDNLKPFIICIIPFALPGSGKSFCYRALQAKINATEGCTFDIVSSDGIRGEMIRQVMLRDKVSHSVAYDKTQKSGP
jgi:hypothetical protein